MNASAALIPRFKRVAFNCAMQTVDEIRLKNLERLIAEFGTQERVAELAETSPVYLSQIMNAARDSKTGKVRQIGDPLARKLETGCNKERGWMDNPPTYIELHGTNDPRTKAMMLMEHLPADQWETALRLLNALAQPVGKNGTHD